MKTDKLIAIQTKLKAPKSKKNTFGNYNYRSAEDICEAVKPLLAEEKCVVTLSDNIIAIGERIYVEATAKLIDASGEVIAEAKAMAREAEEQKGKDASQITGTASSYARKYAMNGLFLLDDTKDADTDEHANETKNRAEKEEKKSAPKKTEPKKNESKMTGQIPSAKVSEQHLVNLVKSAEVKGVTLEAIAQRYGKNDVKELTEEEYHRAMNALIATPNKEEKNGTE